MLTVVAAVVATANVSANVSASDDEKTRKSTMTVMIKHNDQSLRHHGHVSTIDDADDDHHEMELGWEGVRHLPHSLLILSWSMRERRGR